MAKKKKVRKFIQKALARKPRARKLRDILEIPKGKLIPIRLLKAIIKAKAGDTITNPTKTGNRRIKVTRLVERKAIFALNVKRIKKQ